MPSKPKLLSGGNPQIPKGVGDAPVKAWIAAAPGWKSEAAARLDALVEETVPEVAKAVKWNSPLYGLDGRTWFLSFHAFDRYLKVAFHNGAELDPPPPVGSKHPRIRYLHIGEDFDWSDDRLADWIAQASKLPGEKM